MKHSRQIPPLMMTFNIHDLIALQLALLSLKAVQILTSLYWRVIRLEESFCICFHCLSPPMLVLDRAHFFRMLPQHKRSQSLYAMIFVSGILIPPLMISAPLMILPDQSFQSLLTV